MILPNIVIYLAPQLIKLLTNDSYPSLLHDIKKNQTFILLAGLILFLIVIDSQCFSYQDACLPDLGFVLTAPDVTSDQSLLLKGLTHGYIDKEWKEKIGAIYAIIGSNYLTGNYKTFSILSSISLLITTYLFALKISGNRLGSIIAVVAIEFSKTFMWHSDSLAYPNFWMVVFLLSLYPFKRTYLRPICFMVSFVFKAEALAFLPLNVIHEKTWRMKILYIGIAATTGIIAIMLNWVRSTGHLNTENIIYPYISFVLLQQDIWILYLLAPVTIALFYLRHAKVEWSSFLLGAMGYCLLFQYILPLVSTYSAWSYRMLPFVVFFALSLSLIISQREVLVRQFWKHQNAPIDS